MALVNIKAFGHEKGPPRGEPSVVRKMDCGRSGGAQLSAVASPQLLDLAAELLRQLQVGIARRVVFGLGRTIAFFAHSPVQILIVHGGAP